MLCPKCQGSQNLVTFQGGKPSWQTCPECSGTGVTEAGRLGPATITMHLPSTIIPGIHEFPAGTDWSDIAVQLRVQGSKTQAKKNGWFGPAKAGEERWTNRKQTKVVIK